VGVLIISEMIEEDDHVTKITDNGYNDRPSILN